jgi:hypothetical protein
VTFVSQLKDKETKVKKKRRRKSDRANERKRLSYYKHGKIFRF